ncbi:multicopper oxidase family protein [Cupriavidus basilensis]|uniref:Multicopper oxidase CueO n=1 Tax=Cupriavidus basilensis TaxID=68895 RepID=A0A643FLL0_9BURK|nr:multicopper oxidase domain-containing protein [Cupriavidus basilensis]QOT79438.1 multicopper oxidase domain-containing protein [Cupriavidus basilensis]
MDAQGHETVPDEGRRRLFKTTAAGAGAALAGAALPAAPALAKDSDDASLATRSFVEVLPVPLVKQPVAALSPAPLVTRGEGECGRGSHQRWGEFEPRKLYELHVKEALHSFHRDLPTQRVWGYDGMLPGPTVVARYNEPVLVRIFNELPANHIGFGSPEITTHLHNLHMASESDGFTGDYYSSTRFGPTLTGPGGYRDHHYPNCYAGYDAFSSTQGDAREALGTCWYHDHRLDFTGPNVYRGLSGFYLLFDELDSGNEEDANPNALRLPSGVGRYDIPLVFQDRRFDRKGMLAFDSFNSDGLLGDKFLVNGKIQPLFEVERRKYRFRLLNGGPARFYEFHLMYQNAEQDFTYIANDGNLLPAPLTMRKIRMGVAERADIVIDFSKYPIGSQLFLVNRLEQDDGRGPDDKLMKSGTQLLRFDVRSNPARPDISRVPARLRDLPDLPSEAQLRKLPTRVWEFDRSNGGWTVNGNHFDVEKPAARIKRGAEEVWVLRGSGNWHHPVHIHFEEGRILSRNGSTPPVHERGRKDVYVLKPGEEIRVFLRFRDYEGKYLMHCHNGMHEDHAMMVRFDIVP